MAFISLKLITIANSLPKKKTHTHRCTYNTPPDSPRCMAQYNDIIQDIDIYALHSIEGTVKKKFPMVFIESI